MINQKYKQNQIDDEINKLCSSFDNQTELIKQIEIKNIENKALNLKLKNTENELE